MDKKWPITHGGHPLDNRTAALEFARDILSGHAGSHKASDKPIESISEQKVQFIVSKGLRQRSAVTEDDWDLLSSFVINIKNAKKTDKSVRTAELEIAAASLLVREFETGNRSASLSSARQRGQSPPRTVHQDQHPRVSPPPPSQGRPFGVPPPAAPGPPVPKLDWPSGVPPRGPPPGPHPMPTHGQRPGGLPYPPPPPFQGGHSAVTAPPRQPTPKQGQPSGVLHHSPPPQNQGGHSAVHPNGPHGQNTRKRHQAYFESASGSSSRTQSPSGPRHTGAREKSRERPKTPLNLSPNVAKSRWAAVNTTRTRLLGPVEGNRQYTKL